MYIKSDEFKEFSSGINRQETSIEESENDALQTEELEHPNEMVPKREEYKAYFENAKFITVEKVERTITESLDGSSDISYDTYFVSDVYIEKGTDFTEDYACAMIGNEFEEELVSRMEFEEAFGFSYAELDAWEIYENCFRKMGWQWNQRMRYLMRILTEEQHRYSSKVLSFGWMRDYNFVFEQVERVIERKSFRKELEIGHGRS